MIKTLRITLLVYALCILWHCRGKGGTSDDVSIAGDKKTPRIISMIPSATETLFELGAGGSVVGVCDQCQWPEETAHLPKLGSYLNPSTEMILKLKPDVVFMYETQTQLYTALRERGISVVKIRTENLGDLYDTIIKIGKAVDRKKEALGLVDDIKAQLKDIEEKLKSRGSAGVKSVVVVDRMPFALQNIFVSAGQSYLSQLLGMVGGDNCFKTMKDRYPMVSFEAIASCRPEVIIDIRPPEECSPEGKERAEALWKNAGIVYPDGPARKVKIISTDPVTVPGPRVGESVKILYELIHGDQTM